MNWLSEILDESNRNAMIALHRVMCVVSVTWWNGLEDCVNGQGVHPGSIANPKLINPDMKLITVPAWETLHRIFGGGPRLDVFIINSEPDFSPIGILICRENPGDNERWEVLKVSDRVYVKDLKEYICEKQEIDLNKAYLRKIDEVQPGIIAFMALSENSTLKAAGIVEGSKVSLRRSRKESLGSLKAMRRLIKY